MSLSPILGRREEGGGQATFPGRGVLGFAVADPRRHK